MLACSLATPEASNSLNSGVSGAAGPQVALSAIEASDELGRGELPSEPTGDLGPYETESEKESEADGDDDVDADALVFPSALLRLAASSQSWALVHHDERVRALLLVSTGLGRGPPLA